jgi:hypothetical protein
VSLSRKVRFVTTKAQNQRQRHPMVVSRIACAIESDVKKVYLFIGMKFNPTLVLCMLRRNATPHHTPLTVLVTLVDLDQFFWLPVHFSKNKAFL